MTSVERAIESLAALAGKSYIKEEIVHGSYRLADAPLEYLSEVGAFCMPLDYAD